ncbi:type II secretion system F family protein [Candidatus Woesebacteria bacterium]|nr:type II secretion system F family protein [Candidatus Woesebacteria bacterium]
MPYFVYTAKNQFGETVKGKVEAKDHTQAAALLTSRKLLVIKVNPLTEDSFAFLRTALFGVKHTDIVNFTRQLSTMITAGLPLANALSILVRQSKAEMSKLVASLLQDVEGGTSFSKSLAKYQDVFPRIYVQLVNAGEAGGVLDEVLQRLADNMEKEKEFRSKTRGALIYPIIVIIAMMVVGFVMMIFVIPKLTEMYKDFGADLPLPTRILMAISDFMVSFWWVCIGGAVAGVVAFRNWYKTNKGQHTVDKYLLRVPIFGELKQKIILTEFSRTLALLLGAGISLLQALEIVTDGVANVIYRDALKDVTKQVEKGISLSQALSHYEEFPPILHQMMGVGEETGRLDDVLMKLSKYFEQESEQAVKNLTTAMEPLIMIVLGVGVGVMVIAIIMPIYNLTSQF